MNPQAPQTSALNSEKFPRLLRDIGGTHARLAWQTRPGASLTEVATYLCAEHESLPIAIERYLADLAGPLPRCAGIGIANPVIGDHVQMTNHHWSFSIKAVRRTLGVRHQHSRWSTFVSCRHADAIGLFCRLSRTGECC